MIAVQSLLLLAGMVLASYMLSTVLLYKIKDKDRLGNSKGKAGTRLPKANNFLTETKTKGIMK